MPDNYQVVLVRAGDGSAAAQQAAAKKIADATKVPLEKILKSIQDAPFVYKKGLPKDKADKMAAALTKLGAESVSQPEGTPLPGGGAAKTAAAKPSPPKAAATASGDAYGFGSPATPASPATGGGFDFGFGGSAPAAAPAEPGGIDFGTIQPPAAATPATAAGDFPFQLGDSDKPPESEGAGGGFSFSMDAAAPAKPAAAKEKAPSLIERNTDYAAAPAEPREKDTRPKAPPVATATCPRCGHVQPPANECASCGVVMAKAGTPETSGSGSKRMRPVGRPAAQERPSYMGPVMGVVGIAAILAVAFLAGAFNPWLIKFKSMGDPLLKSYGVQLSRPIQGVAYVKTTNAQKAQDLKATFIDMSTYIASELEKMAQLGATADFEARAEALKPYIDSYLHHEANTLKERVLALSGRYYKLNGVGFTLDDITYMTQQDIDASGLQGRSSVQPILNQTQIEEALKQGREQVKTREEETQRAARVAVANVNFDDPLTGTKSNRWEWVNGDKARFTLEARGLGVQAQAEDFRQGAPSVIAIPEPAADYAVEVNVANSPGSSSRGGLVIYQDDHHVVEFAKSAASDAAQILVTMGDAFLPGGSKPAPRGAVRLRIERRRNEYTFHLWNPQARVWDKIDRQQPQFDPKLDRRLGLAAVGGTGVVYTFTGFSVRLL